MSLKNKIAVFLVLVAVMLTNTFSSSAIFSQKEYAVGKFYSYEQKLLCISYRGDTVNYPENSLQGIKSALNKGADFVSVNLEKTADGVFYLCEDESLGNVCNAPYESLSQITSSEVEKYKLTDIYGNETKYGFTSLTELLKKTDSEDGIILDVKSEDKDAVYDVLDENDALDRIIIRVREKSSSLTKWAESKSEKVYVIGVYGGNIIFSTISAVNALTSAEMPAVQYKSKNYFNVAYGEFFTNRYLTTANVRAIVSTCSADFCGQRDDGSDGWNELINKGYSVIETNNAEAFVAYRQEAERLAAEVSQLVGKVKAIDVSEYSGVSVSNLEKATQRGEKLISGAACSLDEAQRTYSELVFALEEMKISTGEVDTRGALNVTAGKVIAAVLVGFALLAGQIYVYKMRKKKEK